MSMRSFKAAVALSNIGVTLLERHCYHDAVLTIREALRLIRAASPGDEDRRTTKESDIQCALRRACHRLSQSHAVWAQRAGQAVYLKVLCANQTVPSDILRAVQNADVFALRIDDCRGDDGAHSMHSEASAILFNYGTACRCLQSSISAQPCPKILYEASNFLHMAYGILVSLKQTDEIEVCRMLGIAMLVLHNLMQLCEELGMPEHYQNYGNKFARIHETLTRFQSMPWWGFIYAASAA